MRGPHFGMFDESDDLVRHDDAHEFATDGGRLWPWLVAAGIVLVILSCVVAVVAMRVAQTWEVR